MEVTTNHLKKKEGSKTKRRSLFAKARRRREGGRRLLHILYLAPFSSPFQRTSERKVTSCLFFLQLVMQWCFMLVYALLCYVGKPWTKEPLLQVKGKGREANCLFLSYSTSKRRGKVLGKWKELICCGMARESSLMLIFVLLIHMLYEFLSFILMYESFWFGKP